MRHARPAFAAAHQAVIGTVLSRASGDDPVTALRLGGVERRIGAADELRCILVGRAPLRHADACRYRHGLAIEHDRAQGEPLAHALGDRPGGVERGPGHQGEELLAADPAEAVDLAQDFAQQRRDVLQGLIAGGVAEPIVDRLEVVEIEHQHRERLAGAAAALDLSLQRLVDRAPVEQSGEAVVARAVPELGGEARRHQNHQRRVEGQHQDDVEEDRADVEGAVADHLGGDALRMERCPAGAKCEPACGQNHGHAQSHRPAQLKIVACMNDQVPAHGEREQGQHARRDHDANAAAAWSHADPGSDEDDREGDSVDPKADFTADEEADAAVQREQRDHAEKIADRPDELGRQAILDVQRGGQQGEAECAERREAGPVDRGAAGIADEPGAEQPDQRQHGLHQAGHREGDIGRGHRRERHGLTLARADVIAVARGGPQSEDPLRAGGML